MGFSIGGFFGGLVQGARLSLSRSSEVEEVSQDVFEDNVRRIAQERGLPKL